MIDNENGVKDISNLLSNMVTQSWNFKWSHSQSIDPSQSLNWNINYVSQNDFYQQDQVGYNTDTRLGQNIYSAINYNKNWRYSNNSLSISLSDSYDLLAEDNELISPGVISTYRTFTAPSLSLYMDQDYCLEMDPDGIIQYTILSDQHLSLQKRKQIIYMMIV